MIQIPPSLPDSSNARRPEGTAVQTVPAVLADKSGVNPGVVLNLPTPVLETPTDGMRARDAATQPGATQVDQGSSAAAVRLGALADVAVEVRQGLNTDGLPQRLLNLLRQIEQLSGREGAAVLWPASEAVRAPRPELAFKNLRRALGDSMMFEMQRLQVRLVPSAAPSPPVAVSGDEALALINEVLLDASGAESAPALMLGETPDATVDEELPQNRTTTAPDGRTASAEKNPPVAPSNQQGVQPPQARLADPATQDGVESAKAGDQTETELPAQAAAPSSQRTESLDGDSQSIRDAIRLLLHGELRWQGELSPGVFAKLQREDAWEEDPHSPGALVKGTLVSVDLDLPVLGRLRVRGMFIKDSVRVTVLPQEPARGALQSEFEDLRSRLRDRGLDTATVRLGDREDV